MTTSRDYGCYHDNNNNIIRDEKIFVTDILMRCIERAENENEKRAIMYVWDINLSTSKIKEYAREIFANDPKRANYRFFGYRKQSSRELWVVIE